MYKVFIAMYIVLSCFAILKYENTFFYLQDKLHITNVVRVAAAFSRQTTTSQHVQLIVLPSQVGPTLRKYSKNESRPAPTPLIWPTHAPVWMSITFPAK